MMSVWQVSSIPDKLMACPSLLAFHSYQGVAPFSRSEPVQVERDIFQVGGLILADETP